MATRKKDTITATYRGPIEAMHGVVMEVPYGVPNPAAWMESVWREEQAAEAAAEEKRQRQQQVLNDRIQLQQEQEQLQLQQMAERLADLEGRAVPTEKDMTEAQGLIMSGQSSLMKAGLELTKQARLHEEQVQRATEQQERIDLLMAQNAELHDQMRGHHANGVKLWDEMQAAAQANIEAEQQRNAELVNQIDLQRNLIEKLRTERNELLEFNDELKSANRELKNRSTSFHQPRR